jgi:LSM domain
VLDEAVEEKAGGEKVRLGMVVIRGNSVVMLEVSCHHSVAWMRRVMLMVSGLQALERIGGDRDR